MTPLLCPKYEVKRAADYSFAAYASETNLKNVKKMISTETSLLKHKGVNLIFRIFLTFWQRKMWKDSQVSFLYAAKCKLIFSFCFCFLC